MDHFTTLSQLLQLTEDVALDSRLWQVQRLCAVLQGAERHEVSRTQDVPRDGAHDHQVSSDPSRKLFAKGNGLARGDANQVHKRRTCAETSGYCCRLWCIFEWIYFALRKLLVCRYWPCRLKKKFRWCSACDASKSFFGFIQPIYECLNVVIWRWLSSFFSSLSWSTRNLYVHKCLAICSLFGRPQMTTKQTTTSKSTTDRLTDWPTDQQTETETTSTKTMNMIEGQVSELKRLWKNKRQLGHQILNLGMIVFSALMMWKGLMCLTLCEAPVVVVLRYV